MPTKSKNGLMLEVKVRRGKISPFIRGWNVWDLKRSEWTPDVQKAILHAYKLGGKFAIEEIVSLTNGINTDISFTTVWPEPKK